ncbi:hypothetical protein JHW43_000381 [Diplocarpon mali]|nr:hypothetical protein JHW43_000381 [Diplocarpon mali]
MAALRTEDYSRAMAGAFSPSPISASRALNGPNESEWNILVFDPCESDYKGRKEEEEEESIALESGMKGLILEKIVSWILKGVASRLIELHVLVSALRIPPALHPATTPEGKRDADTGNPHWPDLDRGS